MRLCDSTAEPEAETTSAVWWCCAGSLPRLLERLVSAKEQQGEEYRLLLKLLLHASHLKVHHPHLSMCRLLSLFRPGCRAAGHGPSPVLPV